MSKKISGEEFINSLLVYKIQIVENKLHKIKSTFSTSRNEDENSNFIDYLTNNQDIYFHLYIFK